MYLVFSSFILIALAATLDLPPTNSTTTVQTSSSFAYKPASLLGNTALKAGPRSVSLNQIDSLSADAPSTGLDGPQKRSAAGGKKSLESAHKRPKRSTKAGRSKKVSNSAEAKHSTKASGRKSTSSHKATKSKTTKPRKGKKGTKVGSTKSGGGTPLPQIIRPKKGVSSAAEKSFEAKLKQAAGHTFSSTPAITGNGVLFWLADLTKDQVQQLKKDSAVASIKPDQVIYLPEGSGGARLKKAGSPSGGGAHKTTVKHGSHSKIEGKNTSKSRKRADKETESSAKLRRKRDASGGLLARHTTVVVDKHAPWELGELSQPRQSRGLSAQYRYQEPAGQGVTIYGIDVSLNRRHPDVDEWLRSPSRPKLNWLYAGGAERVQEDDDVGDGHGSCVWDKAVGPNNGVAKEASFTVVKVGRKLRDSEGKLHTVVKFTVGQMLDGFSVTVRDVVKRKREGELRDPGYEVRSVVSTSIEYFWMTDEDDIDDLKNFIHILGTYGVPVFMGAENAVHKKTINLKDSPLYGANDELDNFFIIGGTDKSGDIAAGSLINPPDKAVIDFWAPALELTCIEGKGHGTHEGTAQGNSYATPMAAGLAAYAMSLPNGPRTPKAVGQWMRKNAIQRVEGGPKIIANDIPWLNID